MRRTAWHAGIVDSAQSHASFESAIDRATLEALHRATDDPQWSYRISWLSAASPAEWHQATTGRGGRIANNEHREKGSNGTIPPELAPLNNLRELDLRENRLRRRAGLRTARRSGGH